MSDLPKNPTFTGRNGTAQEALEFLRNGANAAEIETMLKLHRIDYDTAWEQYLSLRGQIRCEPNASLKTGGLITQAMQLANDWGFEPPIPAFNVDLKLWYEHTKDIPWAQEAYDGRLDGILAQFEAISKLMDDVANETGNRNSKLDAISKILEPLEADPRNVYRWSGTGRECALVRAQIDFWRD